MSAGANRRFGTRPAVAGELRRVVEVTALPAEAVAQSLDRHAQLLEHTMLAEARRRHLHELVDLHGLAAAVRAQRQPEGRRALALAVAGVHHQHAAHPVGGGDVLVDQRLLARHALDVAPVGISAHHFSG
jgi:hypothetical protein